jgi:hypothetical protein
MNTLNELWLYRNGLTGVPLRLRKGQPVGAALLDGDPPLGYGGIELAGLLGLCGSPQLGFRYPILVSPKELQSISASLADFCARGHYYDPAWVILSAEIVGPDWSLTSEECYVALLTKDQLLAVMTDQSSSLCRLSNDQIIRTVDPSAKDPVDRSWTIELQDIKFLGTPSYTPRLPGELQLQAMPSSPFADTTKAANSYYCILHPDHKQRYGPGFALIRNDQLESEYGGLKARLAVLTAYDSEVPKNKVVLDWTTTLAIGLRQGEFVAVSPLPVSYAGFRRRVLGFRHCLCRAQQTTMLDMEKPIARMPEAVFDVLGIESGTEVVLEGLSVDTGKITKLTLHALVDRGSLDDPRHEVKVKTGVPNFDNITGWSDLPFVAIDLEARLRLGISPGTAVYVRPAFSGLVAREFMSISVVLLAATFSAAALQNVALAVISVAVYVFLSGMVLVQRLR